MNLHLPHSAAWLGVCALAFCLGTTTCSNNKDDEDATAQAKSELLLKTSKSWDGAELPDYLKGKPELCVLKVTIPPHCALKKHHHDILSYGIVTKGELTLIRESDKKETTVHEGEAVVETVGTVHHGENRGDTTTEVYVFYTSQEGMPLSVADE